MTLRFPVLMIMHITTFAPVMLNDSRVWPLFSTIGNAQAFVREFGLLRCKVGEFISAVNLLQLMEAGKQRELEEVWINEYLSDTRSVQFRDHIPAAAFFQALTMQANCERQAADN